MVAFMAAFVAAFVVASLVDLVPPCQVERPLQARASWVKQP